MEFYARPTKQFQNAIFKLQKTDHRFLFYLSLFIKSTGKCVNNLFALTGLEQIKKPTFSLLCYNQSGFQLKEVLGQKREKNTDTNRLQSIVSLSVS